VIAVVDDANGKAFAPPLLKTLLIGLNSTAEDVMVRMMCMDVVRDLLVRFGNEVETLQVELLNSLTKLLQVSSLDKLSSTSTQLYYTRVHQLTLCSSQLPTFTNMYTHIDALTRT